MTTALDSSVLVAALASWHERHADARVAVAAALRAEDGPVVPAHVLVEAFSVFTRLPAGYRISPRDALSLLHAALHGRARIVAEDPNATWALLERAAHDDIAGGAVYDLRILRAAQAAGATELLTLNPGDFERFGECAVAIVVP